MGSFIHFAQRRIQTSALQHPTLSYSQLRDLNLVPFKVKCLRVCYHSPRPLTEITYSDMNNKAINKDNGSAGTWLASRSANHIRSYFMKSIKTLQDDSHVNDCVQTYRCCLAVVNTTSDKPAVGSLTFWLASLVPLWCGSATTFLWSSCTSLCQFVACISALYL
jgi:hypothetical protein